MENETVIKVQVDSMNQKPTVCSKFCPKYNSKCRSRIDFELKSVRTKISKSQQKSLKI